MLRFLLFIAVLSVTPAFAEPAPEASALLARWLRAQNQRDFAAYEALYANAFTGVRRVRDRRVELDRNGWMRDRRRMFARPVTVEASDVVWSSDALGTTARFTQTFASSSFSDRGGKQLRLEKSNDRWKIVREEMLTSRVTPDHSEARRVTRPLDELAFVVNGELVLEDDLTSEALARIAPSELKRSHRAKFDVEFRGEANMREVPKTLLALQGRHFRVFGRLGELCEATIGSQFVVSATREFWSRLDEAAPDRPIVQVVSEAELSTWEEASFRLVVKLKPEQGNCDTGTWARPAERPVSIALAATTRGPVEQAALTAFRALPAWRDTQKSYESARTRVSRELDKPAPARWDELPNALQTRTLRGAKRTFVWLRAQYGDGCGDPFYGDDSALFEVSGEDGAPTVMLRDEGKTRHWAEPFALVDLDGDGVEELLADRGEDSHLFFELAVLEKLDARYRIRSWLGRMSSSCGC